MATRLRKYLFIPLLSYIILSLVPITIASAHELEPVSASPSEGEVLPESPPEVRLIFEEEIAEEGSMLQVFDDQGNQVDVGNGGVDLNDPQHANLVVGLPVLSEGVYLVKWQVTVLDGDSSSGEYYFGVGNVTVPQSVPEAADAGIQAGPSSLVWIGLAAGLILLAVIIIFLFLRSRTRP